MSVSSNEVGVVVGLVENTVKVFVCLHGRSHESNSLQINTDECKKPVFQHLQDALTKTE